MLLYTITLTLNICLNNANGDRLLQFYDKFATFFVRYVVFCPFLHSFFTFFVQFFVHFSISRSLRN
jgi:sulfatase maturation enzyme AslB (radical SAM superfamily)